MTKKQNYKKLIYTILALLLLFVAVISWRVALSAFADTSQYTNVLDDLQKDSEFNVNEYPVNIQKTKIDVIRISESVNGELFVYTYQPCQKKYQLKATEINMSLSESVEGTRPYGLTLLNINGVFVKYKVNDLTVSSDDIRYYNITSIFRPFNSNIDIEHSNGQTVSAVSDKVNKVWRVTNQGETISYELLPGTEVITVTQKVVGYCVYDDGLQLDWGSAEGITKAYFVAFDTDKQIDKLISADLTFFATRIQCKICLNNRHDHKLLYDFRDPEYIDFGTGVYNDEPLTITDKEEFGNQGGGNVRPAVKFLKKRIRSTADFILDENNKDYEITSDGQSDLSGTKWILNFYEAQDRYKVNNVWLSFIPGISSISGISDGECELNNVYDVSILRLEFETNGEHYNMGVVDNKQTGSETPINKPVPVEGSENKVKAFFKYLWDCIVKMFTGVSNGWQKFVAILTIIITVVVFVLVVKFIRWICRGLFGRRGNE